jgi:hypothetical protein
MQDPSGNRTARVNPAVQRSRNAEFRLDQIFGLVAVHQVQQLIVFDQSLELAVWG